MPAQKSASKKTTPKTSKKMFKVKKRDGRIEEFNKDRIVRGIYKSATGVGGTDKARAIEIADEVVKRLEKKYSGKEYVKTSVIADVVALLKSPMQTLLSQLQSGGNTIHGVLETLKERE